MTEGDTTSAAEPTEFLARCRGNGEVAHPPPVHVLVHSRADGWALISRDRGPHFRWTSLAARGAGPSTATRAAQAVAVRVLADQGVVVDGWTAGRAPEAPATAGARAAAAGERHRGRRTTHR